MEYEIKIKNEKGKTVFTTSFISTDNKYTDILECSVNTIEEELNLLKGE